jgi:hypothetical protein
MIFIMVGEYSLYCKAFSAPFLKLKPTKAPAVAEG